MPMDPETRFERALLASARGDAEPLDVGAAWSRFAGALDRASAGQGERRPPDDSTRSATLFARPGRYIPSRRVLAYLLVGALGGAGITTVVARRGAVAVVAPVVLTGPTPGKTARPSSLLSRVVPLADDEVAAPAERSAVRPRNPRRHGGASSSALAAEVFRIDAARSANASGDHDEAIRLVDAYHAQFPAGRLAPDADLVALDAAAARGDHTEVARRAAAFLSRYPRDPHAARVRRIRAELGLRAGPGAR